MNDRLQFRIAREEDLPEIVRLLVQDQLGSTREVLSDPLPQVYLNAFNAMKTQPGNDYIIGIINERIVCCYQFTVIHGISRSGSSRAQIEGVRVDSDMRGLASRPAISAISLIFHNPIFSIIYIMRKLDI